VPLADNKWGTFLRKEKSTSLYYLASPVEQEILVGLNAKMISCQIGALSNALCSQAIITSLNIAVINNATFIQLFRQVPPKDWNKVTKWDYSKEPFNLIWLSKFWQYIAAKKISYAEFQNMALIPSCDGHLVPISQNMPLLQGSVDTNLLNVLKAMKCFIVDDSIVKISLHPYALETTAEGILQALTNSTVVNGFSIDTISFSANDSEELRTFLCHLVHPVSPTLVQILKQLPLFEYHGRQGTYSNAQQAEFYVPNDIYIPEEVLIPRTVCRFSNDANLFKILQLKAMTKAKVYQSFVLPAIVCLSDPTRDKVLQELFEKWPQLQHEDKSFINAIQTQQIIPNALGKLIAPTSLLGMQYFVGINFKRPYSHSLGISVFT
jgi:hypothetical protein